VGVGVALVKTLSILLHVLLVLLRVSGEADAIALHKAPASAVRKNHQLVRLDHILCLVQEALACYKGVAEALQLTTTHRSCCSRLRLANPRGNSMQVALYTA